MKKKIDSLFNSWIWKYLEFKHYAICFVLAFPIGRFFYNIIIGYHVNFGIYYFNYDIVSLFLCAISIMLMWYLLLYLGACYRRHNIRKQVKYDKLYEEEYNNLTNDNK